MTMAASVPAQPAAPFWLRLGKPVVGMLLFAHLFWLYVALLQTAPGEALHYYFDAPIWLTLQGLLALALTRWLQRRLPKRANKSVHYLQTLLLGTLLFVVLMTLLQQGIEQLQGYPFSATLLLKNMLMYALLQLLVGGFVLLLEALKEQRQQAEMLLMAEKNAAEQQLQLLQQQMDPHFLFNNLNVLSALIHKNPDEAEDFLAKFTAIYRYQLQQQATPLVTLAQELAFAKDYLLLLNQRFANSYLLEIELAGFSPEQQLVLAGALQLALENVVKHNEASPQQPLHIQIRTEGDWLTVRNTLRPKLYAPESTGLGLKNLQQRALVLFKRDIQVTQQQGEFCLALPLSAL
ncbi:sensor histidine kinase [Rheinheimera sp. 4Y26]|uniref:sensor histidine kinase n=1 Tax=Rheinheimera sp. 4Y26 TaxID=2977811 RepID=UPI0021B09C43|nr:histidine kinase [Rheinheimera sp. 4Y26]MCT6698404.1 histidine kinase [Rheinheimera sp. 4Y26]